jgi:hypothetical protein
LEKASQKFNAAIKRHLLISKRGKLFNKQYLYIFFAGSGRLVGGGLSLVAQAAVQDFCLMPTRVCTEGDVRMYGVHLFLVLLHTEETSGLYSRNKI